MAQRAFARITRITPGPDNSTLVVATVDYWPIQPPFKDIPHEILVTIPSEDAIADSIINAVSNAIAQESTDAGLDLNSLNVFVTVLR